MIVSLIAAQDLNRTIGLNNQLPWDLPEDLAYFKEKTQGKMIIMGRKTFESLPRLLPKRLHIVISRSQAPRPQENVLWANTLEDALSETKKHIPPWPEEVFVIGGGEIYSLALPYTNKIYLTQIYSEFKGDTFFPKFDQKEFKQISKIPGVTSSTKNPTIKFEYLVFERKHPKSSQ